MNKALEAILYFLLNKRIIGKKHFPEKKIIISKTKFVNKEEIKNMQKEYRKFINRGFILRMKKRTGKGTSWHISLNPSKVQELIQIFEEGEDI